MKSIPVGEARGLGRSAGAALGLNAGWSVFGSVTYAACQWGVLVVLARLGSPEVLGEFTLALAFSAPVFLFAQLQLRALQATDAEQAFVFGDYLALRLIATAFTYAGVVAGALYVNAGLAATVILIATAKALDSLADVVFGQWQKAERLDAVAAATTVNGVVSLSAVVVALVTTGSGSAAALAYAIGSAVTLGVVVLLHGSVTPQERLRPRWDAERLRALGTIAVPLGFVLMLVSLNTNVPRFILATVMGTRELGIFAATSYFIVAGTTVINALGQSMSPGMARRHARGDRAGFVRALQVNTAAAALLGIAGIAGAKVFGSFLLASLYSSDYARHSTLLVIVMSAAAVSYVASMLGYGMTAARCFAGQVPLAAAVATVTTVSALLLIPRSGTAGAAWSLVCGSVVQMFGSILLLGQHHRRTGEAVR